MLNMRAVGIRASLLGVMLWVHAVHLAETSSAAPAVDQPCIGFDPIHGTWGAKDLASASRGDASCPKDYAFMAVDRVAGRRPSADVVSVAGFCCPLPSGSLTDEHTFVFESCPEGFVATGIDVPSHDQYWSDVPGVTKYRLRCTRVQAGTFHLGSPFQGQQVSPYPSPLADFIREYLTPFSSNPRSRLNPNQIPVGLRFGLGRLSFVGWSTDFCVGTPPGSILTAKHGKSCKDHEFRLLLNQEPGASGTTPVRITPHCRAIDSPYSPAARCIP